MSDDARHNAAIAQFNQIITGDAFEKFSNLPEKSVHAIVTDPPYGLAFMGRDWDDFEPKEYQEWCEDWARGVKRVLKPGGHLLAFSGNRTHHRLFTGVEDAGYEIRDTLTWHYGNGFPKNTDTLLKPATEFVTLARKPFDGSAGDCFDEHGTAHLNIDSCRIEGGERPDRRHDSDERREGSLINRHRDEPTSSIDSSRYADGTTNEGRYPSNVVFAGLAAANLDEKVGESESDSGTTVREDHDSDRMGGGLLGGGEQMAGYGDTGGPSRYFYTSKATKAERTLNGQIDNGHPTVKPLDLMEWLVTLVSRQGQIVVDPFCGTGTTCKAAKNTGREWIGIEQNEKWADVARVRCGLSAEDPSNVRGEDGQFGLEEFATDGGHNA